MLAKEIPFIKKSPGESYNKKYFVFLKKKKDFKKLCRIYKNSDSKTVYSIEYIVSS